MYLAGSGRIHKIPLTHCQTRDIVRKVQRRTYLFHTTKTPFKKLQKNSIISQKDTEAAAFLALVRVVRHGQFLCFTDRKQVLVKDFNY